MSPGVQQAILSTLLVFSRVGLCFMVLPGISSERIPAQARLFLAISISLALAPIAFSNFVSAIPQNAGDIAPLIAAEALTGLVIGLLVRVLFVALEFSATAMASYLGYSSAFTHSIESTDAATSLSAIVTMPAVVMFFVLDQHTRMIGLLLESYQSFPVGQQLDTQYSLQVVLKALVQAFRLALQLSAPLVVYSLTVNVLFGLLNRMVPQIPAYFMSTPFVMLGGLILLFFLIGVMLAAFGATTSQVILEQLGGR